MSGKINVEFTVEPVEGKDGFVTVSASMDVPGINRVTKTPCVNKVSSEATICAATDIPGYCCVALMDLLAKASPKPKVAK